MMYVTFRRTKTIQFGKRRLTIPVAPNHTSICPVLTCRQMISIIPGLPTDPLFFVPRGRYIVPFSKRTFLSHVRLMLVRAGDSDSTRFTCPSFRRGGASWAFANKIPGEMIQVFDEWASGVTRFIWILVL